MPCRDEGYDYEQVIAKKKAEAKVSPGYLLCEACSLLEEAGLADKMSTDLRAWYDNHEMHETARVKLEAAKKLSSRERRLLGVDIIALQKAFDSTKNDNSKKK
jgi:hypothetical protein